MTGKRWVVTASLVCCAAVVVGSQAVAADGDDWPQWRGPGRDGIVDEAKLPEIWPEQFKILWKVEVGEGHSSPVAAGGKVVLMARQGGDEVILCLEAESGKELWRNAYPVAYEPVRAARGHGKGPKSTATIADGKVYRQHLEPGQAPEAFFAIEAVVNLKRRLDVMSNRTLVSAAR